MPTPTTHLGLEAPNTSDPFLTSGLDSNLELLDQFPGVFIDTIANINTEVGTWGSNQLGMYAYATDQNILWQWNGTALEKPFGQGRLAQALNTSGGNFTSTSPTIVVSTSVTIPPGGRNIEVTAIVPQALNATGAATLYIFEDSTVVQTVPVPQNIELPFSLFTTRTPSAGAHVYSVQIANTTGATTTGLTASATQPIVLTVNEV
jgi:hypothetical protein